ncbi:MAG: glycosyltransferase [Pirellula sp.]|nr:glycosyltransferase [Pirellula sp.]
MSRKIHIGFVVLRMDIGGVERSIARLLDGLPKDRFRMTVICLDRSGKAMDWVENQEVQVIELRKSPGWDFRTIRKLADLIESQRIDILQSHNWGTLFESVWANRKRRVHHIHAERGTVLGPPSHSRIKTALKARLMRHLIGRVDLVMSNSYATALKVRETTGLANLPIEVIPNGLVNPYSDNPLSDPNWDAMRKRTRGDLGVGPCDLLLGVVGRLSPVKNFELALTGFAAYLTSGPDQIVQGELSNLRSNHGLSSRSHLILVGDGPCRDSLEKLSQDLGITQSVQFIGEKKDAWPYYAAMDVFMSTSHSEGMSQSILEAMASGKAIISTDAGDAKRMLDSERCGRTLFEPTAEALKTQLIFFASRQEHRKDAGENAHIRFQNVYRLSSMLDRFCDLYERLMSNTSLRLETNR